ncbi:MAG: sulfotransferase family protein [Anaerolineae bacterium]|nr:sulfotransferase family protein [Anaerolineae bacterium]
MTLRVVGAGLPRTGTTSLGQALVHLLGGQAHYMSMIPGHPFDLGAGWQLALSGSTPDWAQIFEGYNIALDWPTSAFWRELSEIYPDALMLLSVRESAEIWWESADATILPYARMSLAPDWQEGMDFHALLERFTGTPDWNDKATLMAAYDRHNEAVRQTVPSHRLLEWKASDGWEPICEALGVPVPDEPFPWTNQREEWFKED